ncbi:uncharacterized protein LOC115067226 isoform X9 [Nannospalax galili]|uniref:uncharacterized protein LOC115067226 isoform X9 n=1 Tax=Nannospalax galili TaxID=1026970 RepID=UPI00111BF63A|nr:uncharacterized protein LOC115067226 isoform X9 [Nannospalax galili]XP_029410595.1 uncharacterized protein LOC115067226 isoform X9 [Nannospalax galili]XP_029410596.1 uncharacterized protein LOC115067226 isoform X9 [Nannospalax galili]
MCSPEPSLGVWNEGFMSQLGKHQLRLVNNKQKFLVTWSPDLRKNCSIAKEKRKFFQLTRNKTAKMPSDLCVSPVTSPRVSLDETESNIFLLLEYPNSQVVPGSRTLRCIQMDFFPKLTCHSASHYHTESLQCVERLKTVSFTCSWNCQLFSFTLITF